MSNASGEGDPPTGQFGSGDPAEPAGPVETAGWAGPEFPAYPDQQQAAQQYPPQPYPAQPYPAQQYPAQQYPAQQYPAQQYSPQQYPAPQYPAPPHPGQPYPIPPYPGQPYPPPYGYPYRPTTNGLAVAGFVCSFFGLVGVLGIIFGCVALAQIRRRGQRGQGLAIAGLVIGSFWVCFYLIGLIIAAGS
jgi:hypothetical protein